MDKHEILEYLYTHKQEFETNFDITNIALFGSYATGKQHKDSDIDLVVDMKTKNYFKLIAFENFLHEKLQKKVDAGFLNSMKSFVKNSIKDDLIYIK